MMYEIYHKTTFEYASPVSFSHNLVRLSPKWTPTQRVITSHIVVEPCAYEQSTFIDMFGNETSYVLIREAHHCLSVTGHSSVFVDDVALSHSLDALYRVNVSYQEALTYLGEFHPEAIDAKLFLFESARIPKASKAIRSYALDSFHPNRSLVEATVEFMRRIFEEFTFVSGFSDVTTPIEEIFEAKQGVCQDFAQFAIAALRSIGLPAKYMSGYIETEPNDGERKLFGVDASHAWVAVYIPTFGWMEFDPTNNIIPSGQHIVLSSGRDYNDIAPLRGVVKSSGESKLSICVDVRAV